MVLGVNGNNIQLVIEFFFITLQELPNVIVLNVGGTIYTTTKATLHRDRSSMLAALFSGRYKIPIDPNGRFFIDRDGQNFSFILAYLRGESCHPPAHLAVKVCLLLQCINNQLHKLITKGIAGNKILKISFNKHARHRIYEMDFTMHFKL